MVDVDKSKAGLRSQMTSPEITYVRTTLKTKPAPDAQGMPPLERTVKPNADNVLADFDEPTTFEEAVALQQQICAECGELRRLIAAAKEHKRRTGKYLDAYEYQALHELRERRQRQLHDVHAIIAKFKREERKQDLHAIAGKAETFIAVARERLAKDVFADIEREATARWLAEND